MAPVLLITIPFSHYCEKARWALERAGVAYEEEPHPPIVHYRATFSRGAGRTVPVLVDGATVYADSTEIVAFAQERAPAARKLLPASPELRAQALALEELFDRSLGPAVRRVAYFYLLTEPELCRRLFAERASRMDRALVRAAGGLVTRFLAQGLGINPRGAARSLERLREVFAQVNSRLSDGRTFLLGDSFGVADLTFAALSAPLLFPAGYGGPTPSYEECPPSLRALVDELRGQPAGAHVLRMYSAYR